MENKLCPQCSGKMYNNKGISKKNNKPYENWKCGECKYIEWVDVKEQGNGNQIVMDEIARLDARIDKASELIAHNIRMGNLEQPK